MLISSPFKPHFAVTSSLCKFRSSKGYLWGLVQNKLLLLQASSSTPLNCLDAACHALLTREMFPPYSHYFGLDISSFRLMQAQSLCRDGDILFRGDLTQSLPFSSFFDAVVSLNTMSHLSLDHRLLALNNLSLACKKNGTLFVNTYVDNSLMHLVTSLLNQYQVVETCYFDSYLSHRDENSSLVNSRNVVDKIISNEMYVPNDASLHSQVLVIASRKIHEDPITSPPIIPTGQVVCINDVPNITVSSFSDDRALAVSLMNENSFPVILFTPFLLESSYGNSLKSFYLKSGFIVYSLSQASEVCSSLSNVVVLGLENEWTSNLAHDRILINEIRSLPNLSINFCIVSARAGSSCTPSLIVSDV